ncbi:hypothetical protein DOS74_03175 [Staphylococcus felis]|uniref:Uncharacterized protein n=1 Tax=Staphylococcus felis TaxID=46127 RepID=A0A3E0ILB5_9STAP|nr:hypothetical protein [Staphylococcus felis]REH82330.1 hypothetical protein DOS61_09755 [Staphylococcus felis]REH90218.1 hypothetical protein DOS83_12685 [Staphylococcus felis]REH92857.1 hypothetical protein DOS58_00370 [Staphylococcus felis]REI17873.1 hypothetical protein DOS74_03175 [Staphylococcus felis]REI18771.1 hypothetical protein DOS75_02790 [Staphylococcus felis]
MAAQLEIIMGSYKNDESLQRFENMVNQFLRTHKIIDIEYKVNTSQENHSLKHTQIAYITYDDELENTWKGIFNHLVSSEYEYKDLLKAVLKVTDISIAESTIDKIVDYYENENMVVDLADELNIKIEEDETL